MPKNLWQRADAPFRADLSVCGSLLVPEMVVGEVDEEVAEAGVLPQVNLFWLHADLLLVYCRKALYLLR